MFLQDLTNTGQYFVIIWSRVYTFDINPLICISSSSLITLTPNIVNKIHEMINSIMYDPSRCAFIATLFNHFIQLFLGYCEPN